MCGPRGPGFISEPEQFSKNRSYCETYDHTVIEEGVDLDVSGGVMSRPTFDDFLERVKAGVSDRRTLRKRRSPPDAE